MYFSGNQTIQQNWYKKNGQQNWRKSIVAPFFKNIVINVRVRADQTQSSPDLIQEVNRKEHGHLDRNVSPKD